MNEAQRSECRVERLVVRRVVCAALLVNDHIVCGPRHYDATMRAHLELINEPYSSANVVQDFIDQWAYSWTEKRRCK